jgi:hypothetical protein
VAAQATVRGLWHIAQAAGLLDPGAAHDARAHLQRTSAPIQ